jgi:hypothetical protein
VNLAGSVSEGSGAVNEDRCGVIEADGQVSAAWVFDGVTGINSRNVLPGASDACWIVDKAHGHLLDLAAQDVPLRAILQKLVERLKADWRKVEGTVEFPVPYDPPATCLVLVKRYADGWQALRLGDSVMLTEFETVTLHAPPPTPLLDLEEMLRQEARRCRDTGLLDFKSLLQEFRPQLAARRQGRNTPGNYSVLVADDTALRQPELIALGWPRAILLCSDGFYRAVDHYGLHSDASLMKTCSAADGVGGVLQQVRATEAGDPACSQFLRFKPADDATAVCLLA